MRSARGQGEAFRRSFPLRPAPRYDILNPRHRPPAAPLVAPHFCPWLYYGGTGTVDEMDHKERVAQGQNGGTKNEEKDGRTPFAGRVGSVLFAEGIAADVTDAESLWV